MWTEERLNKMLTTPSEALSWELGRLEGDILVLGAGGKMGPTLCVLAKNALRAAGVEKRVIAVSRFSDPLVVELLRENGVEMISADLLAPGALDSLPDAENVIYMAGKKFGTDGNEYATWAMNTWLPSRVAERYQSSRIVVFSSGNLYPKVGVHSGGATEETRTEPLAFEYAVRCDVRDVRARHTYWPVLLRRHNTEYVTERCSLANPIEVVVGGTGYLTQQIHCLYGKVRDCTTSNARHLNDFTGSAYCMVENCHGDGDFHGAYVTHGQFEHDLTYVGNSGLLSFANSGPTWGSSAKRITVVRHTGFWGIGFAKVSDLTLQDVAVCRTGAYDGVNTEGYGPCGTFLLNADGLQMRGCTAEKLVLTQRSRRAKRPAIVEGCWFRDGIEVVRTGEGAVAPGTPLILRDNLTGPGGPQQAEGTE